MNAEAFRRHGHELVDWIADYLEHSDRYPVLARVKPGEIAAALPAHAPEDPEPFDAIMADFERVLVPGLTHWNHPRFFAYFAITRKPARRAGRVPVGGLNQQAMLWRTSPAATELEDVALGWLRRLIGLPDTFEGVIYDTASIATLHALAAARQAAVPGVRPEGLAGRSDVGRVAVYCSEQAHSSVDKAVITLGLGEQCAPQDRRRRRIPDAGRSARRRDPRRIAPPASCPIAVVATVGTTSTTSIDPVPEIADDLRARADLAARRRGVRRRGGHAAVARARARRRRARRSLVVNPHKWLFTPFDLSAFYCRRMDLVRAAFSLTPDYLRTPEPEAQNLMDTGIQLGRRFRALKLWMVLRSYGARGIREHLDRHLQLARQFAAWVDATPTSNASRPCRFRWSVSDGSRPAGAAGSRSSTRPTNGWSIRSIGQERYFFPTRACAGGSPSAWRSATCARRKRTSAAPGNS